MWLTPSVVPINAAERYYETGVWHLNTTDAAAAAAGGAGAGAGAAAAAAEPADLRLALREVVCEECRMGHGLSRQLLAAIASCEQEEDDEDGVWLRVAAADKGEGGGGRKQSQVSDDGTAEWRFRLSELDVQVRLNARAIRHSAATVMQGVLQRSVAMAAGVSGSLAEVRTAKALLLLADDMAFDTIADPLARDADMVAPLPLQVRTEIKPKARYVQHGSAGDRRRVCGRRIQRQRALAVRWLSAAGLPSLLQLGSWGSSGRTLHCFNFTMQFVTVQHITRGCPASLFITRFSCSR